MSVFRSFPKGEKKPKLSKTDAWKALKIRAAKKIIEKQKQFVDKDFAFYSEIWKENLHICSICNCDLGANWNKWNFHHIKLKSKFPELRYDKNNVVLVCLQCHSSFHT